MPTLKKTIPYIFFIFLFVLGQACSSNNKKVSSEKGDSEEISLSVQKEVLDNGLTVLLSENHKLPVISFYIYYKVGGKFETKGITGASHFLEHMMFKGAKKYGPGEFDKTVEGNGGVNNAFTTNDNTVYYESLPSEHLNTIIDLEADRMQNLALEPASFEKEKQVVLEERRMRYENSDRGKLYLSMMSELFKGTPYGTSVIGDIEDLKTVTRDQIYEYFKKFYAPNNAIVVVVGDFDSSDVMQEIKNKFGPIPATKDLAKIKSDILKNTGFEIQAKRGGRSVKIKGQSPNPNFMWAFPSVKVGDKDSYSLDILSSIIGGGESSYLSEEFVLTRKPVLSNIYASNYTLQEQGVFFIGGELLSQKSLNTTRNSLFAAVKKSCDKAINDRSLEKVKNQYMVDFVSGLDTNAGVARSIGDREFYYNDYEFYKKELSHYMNITKKDLEDVCRKYLNPKNSIFLSIWNKH